MSFTEQISSSRRRDNVRTRKTLNRRLNYALHPVQHAMGGEELARDSSSLPVIVSLAPLADVSRFSIEAFYRRKSIIVGDRAPLPSPPAGHSSTTLATYEPESLHYRHNLKFTHPRKAEERKCRG